MLFERTRDFELVRAVLTHPSQARMSSEDGTDIATWSPCEDARIWYLAAYGSDELVGIFTFAPQNTVCYEIHAALLPRWWGARTRIALDGALKYSFTHLPARRVVCGIPDYNRLAIRLAKDCGMREYGRNPASFMKHGRLHDQVLLGIGK